MNKENSGKSILDRLQESEDLYRTLVSSMVYPIIIHIDGKVVFANNIVLEFAGLTPEEITGRDLAEIFRDPEDSANADHLYRLLSDPNVTEEEIDIRTPGGYVMLHTFLLRNNRIRYKGQDAVLSILFDITDRKKLERYIIDKVLETEEKDRKQFAADLHDDLGPTLSAIKLHLGMLEPDCEKKQLSETLEISKILLNEAIAKMRIIANNLMPRLIDDYGLEAALNAFIKTVQQEGAFSVKFSSNLGSRRFNKHTELHLYRIICELINNTIKHAGASVGTLRLNFSDNILKIFYSDNGIGYNIEKNESKPYGMGLGNIINRTDIIAGTISFSRKNGKTEVRIVKTFAPA